MTLVRSPPSSRIMLGRQPLGPSMVRPMHQSYSSSVSPFQAKTGTPASAMAEAAWSWVEKILQELQRTSAPSALSVSIKTAVWIVMCRQPAMHAPASTCASPNSARSAISPGISVSAMAIFLVAPVGEREVLHLVVGAVHHCVFLRPLVRSRAVPLPARLLASPPGPHNRRRPSPGAISRFAGKCVDQLRDAARLGLAQQLLRMARCRGRVEREDALLHTWNIRRCHGEIAQAEAQ